MLIPTVIKKQSDGTERAFDIFSHQLSERIVYINGEINQEMANAVVPQILHLNQEDPNDPIDVYINSGGGSVYDGLAIVDAMNFVSNPVRTLVMGLAGSMGAVILAAGEKGHRRSLPHSTIMIHEVSSGTRGKFKEMADSFEEAKRLNDLLKKMVADSCGKTPKQISKEWDRDSFMDPEAALEFGLIDEIVKKQ